MPYTFEGSNSRSYFLCQFIDMATPLKIIINKHAQGFSNRNLSYYKVTFRTFSIDPYPQNSIANRGG